MHGVNMFVRVCVCVYIWSGEPEGSRHTLSLLAKSSRRMDGIDGRMDAFYIFLFFLTDLPSQYYTHTQSREGSEEAKVFLFRSIFRCVTNFYFFTNKKRNEVIDRRV